MGPFPASLPLLEKSHSNVSTASAPPSPLPDINTIEVNYWDSVDWDNIKNMEQDTDAASLTSVTSNSSSESNTPTTKPKKRKRDELAKLTTTFLNPGNKDLNELKKQKKSKIR